MVAKAQPRLFRFDQDFLHAPSQGNMRQAVLVFPQGGSASRRTAPTGWDNPTGRFFAPSRDGPRGHTFAWKTC